MKPVSSSYSQKVRKKWFGLGGFELSTRHLSLACPRSVSNTLMATLNSYNGIHCKALSLLAKDEKLKYDCEGFGSFFTWQIHC